MQEEHKESTGGEEKIKWRVPKRRSEKSKKQKDTYKLLLYPDFHTQYRARKKQLGQLDSVVTRPEFRKVVAKFLELVAYKILNEGFIFHIPYGCGAIRINKTRHKVRDKNFYDNLAVKAWDYTYRFVWDKTLAYFADMDLRIFYPSRKLKTLKRERILDANEDPMMKDMIGYAPNSELRDLRYLSGLRKKTKRLKRLDELDENNNDEKPNNEI
jgi:hypothetical protein